MGRCYRVRSFWFRERGGRDRRGEEGKEGRKGGRGLFEEVWISVYWLFPAVEEARGGEGGGGGGVFLSRDDAGRAF